MNDYLVRATAANASIRAFAVTSLNLVQYARDRHDTTPVMTAALGRSLSAALMMGSMMKGERDLLTLQIVSEGPGKGLTVTADANGHVKGYVNNPHADVPLKYAGKLDVGGAMGPGVLSVIKDLGLKEPYIGQCELQTGEIAEDITYYFATSEQIPSVVGLGVLCDHEGVRQAGGFIIQLMPFTPDEVIDRLEAKLKEIDTVTNYLEKGLTPEEILEEVLGEFGLEITDTMPVSFVCDCSKERILGALATLNQKDMQEMIDAGDDIEVKCHFCNSAYKFTPDDLAKILAAGKKK